MSRTILTYPNPILTTPATRVSSVTPAITALIDDMIEAMRAAKGVGLAAPQLGESLKIVVIEHVPGPKDDAEDAVPLQILINPKIVSASRETDVMNEGCLSLPGVEVPVTRPIRIKVRAEDTMGRTVQFPATGFHARIIQHELDHLAGILIIDHADDRSATLASYKSRDQHSAI